MTKIFQDDVFKPNDPIGYIEISDTNDAPGTWVRPGELTVRIGVNSDNQAKFMRQSSSGFSNSGTENGSAVAGESALSVIKGELMHYGEQGNGEKPTSLMPVERPVLSSTIKTELVTIVPNDKKQLLDFLDQLDRDGIVTKGQNATMQRSISESYRERETARSSKREAVPAF